MSTHALLSSRKLWLVWLLLLGGFLALAFRAATGSVLTLDISVARDVQSLPEWLGRSFDFENWLGETTPLAAVTFAVAFLLVVRRLKVEAALMILGFLPRMADVVVKLIVGEPRPSADLVGVSFPHDDLSFPSGHVIGITIVFGLVCLFAPALLPNQTVKRVIQAVCLLLVLTIWLARVWVGAHWPSDTLGGYLYAALFLVPVSAWYQARVVSA